MAAKYSYIGLAGEVVVIDDVNINFRGAWSGTTSYAVKDAASYNSRWFLVVTAHTGVTPPSVYTVQTPVYWSPLVLVEGDPTIADTASEIAAAAAVATANQALALASAGTAAAAAAYSLATVALNTAWAGTTAPALDGVYGLARTALDTAWVGTGSASAAQGAASIAYGLATVALDTAWAGTSDAAAALASALSMTLPGTFSFWVSGSADGPPRTELVFTSGLLHSATSY